MDQNSEDVLKEILQRLAAFDDQMKQLSGRLNALEELWDMKETSESAPGTAPEIVPPPLMPAAHIEKPAVPIKPTVDAGTPPEILAAPAPAAMAASVTPKPAPGVPPAEPAKPKLPVFEPSAMPEFQTAAAQLRPGTIPPKKPKESWEVRIATYWLPRIGLLFLALVCGLFAREHAQGPLGKVIVAYLTSIGLMAVGLWYEKRFPIWARPVLAGGLAFSYFASYAMGFVEPMRLLDHLGAKLVVLGLNLAVIFGVAHWKKSEVIGGTALLLGYLTTGVVGNDVAAFSSSLALSVAALVFLWLNQWFTATAVAAAATYIAHFYVWKALPEADMRTALESFWHHFMFLSLYFVVFAAAGLVGKKAALAEGEDGKTRANPMSRRNLLSVLTQTNVAAYLGGMIAVFKLTEIYWDQSWMFFFPLAAVCAGLGLMFVGLAAVQTVYLVAATVCFSLGILALATPLWLPIFLAAQALVMLWFARGRFVELWVLLSLAVLAYAIGYLVSGGAIDALQFTAADRTVFPWWTYGAVTAVVLAYSARWEIGLATKKADSQAIVAYMVAVVAAWVWVRVAGSGALGDGMLAYCLAIPAVAAVLLVLRVHGLAAFVVVAAPLTFLEWNALKGLGEWSVAPVFWWALAPVVAAGMGLAAEKRLLPLRGVSRLLWCTLYLWAAAVVSMKIVEDNAGLADTFTFVMLFAGVVAVGFAMRSAAIAKAGYVFVLVAPVLLASYNDGGLSPFGLLGTAGILAVAAFPVALGWWRDWTGDSQPLINQIGQAFVVFVVWSFVYKAGVNGLGWNSVFTHGLCAALVAVYAAAGRFPAVVVVYALCAATVGIMILYRLGDELRIYGEPEDAIAVPVVWSLAGVLLVVAGERVLSYARRMALPWGNSPKNWLSFKTMKMVTGLVAAGTLVMAVMALRTLPDLKLFYFTGAMVAAAFVWIVFGFLFNEPVYRKSGFVLLCLGIVKGLVWDVLSLKETFYRLVSWSVLGLLALAASFLYTRFRGRIGGDGEPAE